MVAKNWNKTSFKVLFSCFVTKPEEFGAINMCALLWTKFLAVAEIHISSTTSISCVLVNIWNSVPNYWQLTCQFTTWQSPAQSSSHFHKWLITNHPLHESIMSLSSIRVHLQLMQSQNWLPWQRPLDPQSRLCLHWIACPRKPTPRIQQRALSVIQLKL